MLNFYTQKGLVRLPNNNVADLLVAKNEKEAIDKRSIWQKFCDLFGLTKTETAIRQLYNEIWHGQKDNSCESLQKSLVEFRNKCSDPLEFDAAFNLTVKPGMISDTVQIRLSTFHVATCSLANKFNPSNILLSSTSTNNYVINSKFMNNYANLLNPKSIHLLAQELFAQHEYQLAMLCYFVLGNLTMVDCCMYYYQQQLLNGGKLNYATYYKNALFICNMAERKDLVTMFQRQMKGLLDNKDLKLSRPKHANSLVERKVSNVTLAMVIQGAPKQQEFDTVV